MAQIDTITLPFTPASGDTLVVNIGTGSVSQSFTTDVATTLSLLNSSVDTLGVVNSSVNTASGILTFQAKTAGTPFTAFLSATGGSFSSTTTIANEVNIAQVDSLTISRAFGTGDTVAISVAGSGTSIPFSTSSDATASAINTWLNTVGTVTSTLSGSSPNYTFTVTAATPGTPFTSASATVNASLLATTIQPNVFAVAQVDSLTIPRDLVAGDTLSVTLSGSAPITVTYSGSEAATISSLTAALDALSEVSATSA